MSQDNSQGNTQDNAQNKHLDLNDSAATDSNANVEITPEMQGFYQRADAIIGVANSQLGDEAHSGQVGASLLYAAARYSASVASIGFVKGDDFAKEKMISLNSMLNNTVKCSVTT